MLRFFLLIPLVLIVKLSEFFVEGKVWGGGGHRE